MEQIFYSGGAQGSDTFLGKIASNFGYKVIHFYPSGLNCPSGNTEVKDLEEGILMCHNVQTYLGRCAPKYSPAKELCARDWNQVKDTNFVIAIGTLTNDQRNVLGGTGWAVAMAIWNMTQVIVLENNSEEIYRYDFTKKQFVKIGLGVLLKTLEQKQLTKITGIGTRKLNQTTSKTLIVEQIFNAIQNGLKKQNNSI